MKRFLIYVAVSLLTAGLGITLTVWPSYRNPVRRAVVLNAPIKISNDKDAAWEIVQPVGKDPGWTIWPIKYQLHRVNGKWVIVSSKIVPPLT